MALKKLIATDLDGTLLYPWHPFSVVGHKNAKFARRFVADGGHLCLVTSRGLEFSHKVARFLHEPLNAICYSGALICHDGQPIYEAFLAPGIAKAILDDVRGKCHVAILYSKDRNMVYNRKHANPWTNFCYHGYSFFLGPQREHYSSSPKIYEEELAKDRIYKLMIIVGFSKKKRQKIQDLVASLREKYPKVEIGWNGPAVEVAPKGAQKAAALSFYLDYTKIGRDNVLVVGDDGNDVPLFAAYPENSYCMAHSTEEVRNHAAHIIRRFFDLEHVVYPLEEKHPKERKKVTK